MNMLSALVANLQRGVRPFLLRAALTLASLACAAVALGFATSALYATWRIQYGVVYASIDLAAIYLAVAILLWLGRNVAPATRNRRAAARGDGVADSLLTEPAEPQAAAVAAGAQLAKQLTPLQLVLLGVLSGFFAGRKM